MGKSSAAVPPPAMGYLAQHPLFEQIPELAKDIAEPEYCSLGSGNLQSVNAWFGPARTVTLQHTPQFSDSLCFCINNLQESVLKAHLDVLDGRLLLPA